jgi:hypothetical protein
MGLTEDYLTVDLPADRGPLPARLRARLTRDGTMLRALPLAS